MIFYYSGQEIIWTKFAKRYLRVCFTFTPNHTYYDWTSDHAWRFQNFGACFFLFWFELSESPITYLDVLSVYLSCHARNQSSSQLIIFRNFRDQSCKNTTIVCVYLNSTFRDSVFFLFSQKGINHKHLGIIMCDYCNMFSGNRVSFHNFNRVTSGISNSFEKFMGKFWWIGVHCRNDSDNRQVSLFNHYFIAKNLSFHNRLLVL